MYLCFLDVTSPFHCFLPRFLFAFWIVMISWSVGSMIANYLLEYSIDFFNWFSTCIINLQRLCCNGRTMFQYRDTLMAIFAFSPQTNPFLLRDTSRDIGPVSQQSIPKVVDFDSSDFSNVLCSLFKFLNKMQERRLSLCFTEESSTCSD